MGRQKVFFLCVFALSLYLIAFVCVCVVSCITASHIFLSLYLKTEYQMIVLLHVVRDWLDDCVDKKSHSWLYMQYKNTFTPWFTSGCKKNWAMWRTVEEIGDEEQERRKRKSRNDFIFDQIQSSDFWLSQENIFVRTIIRQLNKKLKVSHLTCLFSFIRVRITNK